MYYCYYGGGHVCYEPLTQVVFPMPDDKSVVELVCSKHLRQAREEAKR